MSVLWLYVCRLWAPYIMNLGVCFKKLLLVKVGAFAWCSVKIRVIFGVRFERRKVDFKNTPTRKLKHANSILKSFEYFCQISWKSILIISSYTVSNFARFLRHSVQQVWATAQPVTCQYWQTHCKLRPCLLVALSTAVLVPMRFLSVHRLCSERDKSTSTSLFQTNNSSSAVFDSSPWGGKRLSETPLHWTLC